MAGATRHGCRELPHRVLWHHQGGAGPGKTDVGAFVLCIYVFDIWGYTVLCC